MNEVCVALYARVSSDQQVQDDTVASQLAALKQQISQDGGRVLPEHEYVDEGYSGSTLIRPALEKLRDAVSANEVTHIYVHSPDRLARKYAYQVMLIDEFHRAGVDVTFLNKRLGESPEDELLLQVQGIIAEYEREKILERCRRGKRHKAQCGSINVLGGAPYGYRYIKKNDGADVARYEIQEQEAEVVRQIFTWIGRERWSIGDVKRHLDKEQVPSPKGKVWWDRSTLWGLLKNPAYQGKAAFGKTRVGPLRPRLRPQKGGSLQPKDPHSVYDVPHDEWLYIPVPALVSEELFEAVQMQLEENRRCARARQRGVRYLLQGLLRCSCCGYAYYGKAISLSARKGHKRDYAYYRCIGSDAYRFGGQRLCSNTQIRTDRLEEAVWSSVCDLIRDPQRLSREYQRRLSALQSPTQDGSLKTAEKQIATLEKSIARLIDGYAEGYIEKSEAEPRIRAFKERIRILSDHVDELRSAAHQETNLQLVIGKLEQFAGAVETNLDKLDWLGRRDLIRTLVKRVELDHDKVNIVYRIENDAFGSDDEKDFLPHCRRAAFTATVQCTSR